MWSTSSVSRLTTAERIVCASAIVLFVAALLPWFVLDSDVYDANRSGWDVDFPWGALPVIIGLAMLAHLTFANFAPDIRLPDLPWPRVHLVGGPLAALLVVTKLLIGETIAVYELDRAFGIYIAAVAAVALAFGGVRYHRDHV